MNIKGTYAIFKRKIDGKFIVKKRIDKWYTYGVLGWIFESPWMTVIEYDTLEQARQYLIRLQTRSWEKKRKREQEKESLKSEDFVSLWGVD